MIIPIIVGPTASGKTKLGIELAKKINGEIISADSMQLYKYMDIGTAKVTEEEAEGIKHYLINILEPTEKYSAYDFKKDAEEIIDKIIEKGKIPIIVGGTGLYINSLVYDYDFGYKEKNIEDDFKRKIVIQNRRKYLNNLAQTEEGYNKIIELAKQIDIDSVNKIPIKDKKRIIRIIEIYEETNKKKSDVGKKKSKYDFKIFMLDLERNMLYKKINDRVEKMIDLGLIEETTFLYDKYAENIKSGELTAFQAIGYKEIYEYIIGNISKDEAISNLKKFTRHYAKRQVTWFKKNNPIYVNMNNLVKYIDEKDKIKIDEEINNILKNIVNEISK